MPLKQQHILIFTACSCWPHFHSPVFGLTPTFWSQQLLFERPLPIWMHIIPQSNWSPRERAFYLLLTISLSNKIIKYCNCALFLHRRWRETGFCFVLNSSLQGWGESWRMTNSSVKNLKFSRHCYTSVGIFSRRSAGDSTDCWAQRLPVDSLTHCEWKQSCNWKTQTGLLLH